MQPPERRWVRVVVHASWTLAGLALPMLAAFFAMPRLLQLLGAERAGLMTLVWVLLGYFGLFDLGLGRALTTAVAAGSAEQADASRARELRKLVSSGMFMALVLGIVAAAALWLLAPHFMPRDLLARADFRSEWRSALLWLIAAIPLAVLTAALRGILEGEQAFRYLALVRAVSGAALFIAPWASATVLPRLDIAVASTLVVRAAMFMAHWVPCRRWLRWKGALDRDVMRRLLTTGGWMTVSGVVGPVIIYADRFVVGRLTTGAELVFYSAPFEVISRLLVIPMAVSTALLPALARLGRDDARSARTLASQTYWINFAAIAAVVVPATLTAPLWLEAWLGADFGARSASITRWLLVAFALNAVAHVPLVALYSAGKARDVALLHLVELPIYLVVLGMAVSQFGLLGAAVTWFARAAIDWAALWMMDRRASSSASAASRQ